MRVAVIGAGVAGLVAAYRIGREGHEVDVYERWPGLGGQAATLDVGGGHLLERYYHHLFTSDRHIASLYDELGMPDELRWEPSSMAFFAEGRSRPFTTPFDLLRYRPLPPLARLRMGLAIVRLQRGSPTLSEAERVTARDWINEAMGRHAWAKIWGPLLRGKFGHRADDISMAWLQSKLTLRRQLKGEEAREEKLGYPRRSWEPLFETLRDRVHDQGGRVLIDRPAAGLVRSNGHIGVVPGAEGSFRAGHDPRRFAQGGEVEDYDRVVATVPSGVFSELLDERLRTEIGGRYLGQLHSIEYHAALCLLIELDRSFTPFYWTNVADTELPFVGLIEHTNLVGPEQYDGRRFLYVANYLPPDHEWLSLSADELLAVYEPGLRKVNPGFHRSWVRNLWLHRERDAQPIVDVGYHERIPPLHTGARGLWLANTTQVYPEDRGTNYAVRLGDDVARALLAEAPR